MASAQENPDASIAKCCHHDKLTLFKRPARILNLPPPRQRTSPIHVLPLELLHKIYEYLPETDALCLALTCKLHMHATPEKILIPDLAGHPYPCRRYPKCRASLELVCRLRRITGCEMDDYIAHGLQAGIKESTGRGKLPTDSRPDVKDGMGRREDVCVGFMVVMWLCTIVLAILGYYWTAAMAFVVGFVPMMHLDEELWDESWERPKRSP